MISEDPCSNETLKKSYALILPYIDQITPLIISLFSSQPDLLGEASRVMSIAPIDFIGITLPHTLPELFASCDQKVLRKNCLLKRLRYYSNTLTESWHIFSFRTRPPRQRL